MVLLPQILRNSVAYFSELPHSEPCINHAMCCCGWTNVLMVRICSWMWRRVKCQLGRNNTKQKAIARKSALTCSATVHPWRPLSAVYVCRYLLCVLAYVLEMSHYTEDHMYTHPYLAGHTHWLVFIRMYTYVSVYHTHNQYLCTRTVIHIRIHGSWWILCQH